MKHKESMPCYKHDVPITPYQKAAAAWDNRIGSSIVQAKNWRFIAIASLLLSIILSSIIILQIASRKEHIYIAQVSKTGQVQNVALLPEQYNPSDAQNQYVIQNYISYIFSQPFDPVVVKSNWLKAYAISQGSAVNSLNLYAQQHDPIASVGKETRSISSIHIYKKIDNNYQASWTVTSFNLTGEKINSKHYSGNFTVKYQQPSHKKEIKNNPLGIYIIYFNYKVLGN